MTSHSPFSPRARIALLRSALSKTPHSAALLFELSEALDQAGEIGESVELFCRAFALDPSACSGVGNHWPNPNPERGARMRARAQSLIAAGVRNSAVVAALAIGESLCGNEKAVRGVVDYELLFRSYTLNGPGGFADFNTELADEIRRDLKYYDEPAGRSIRKGWRNNDITQSTLPAGAALTAAIRAEIETYILNLPASPEHPFVASRPESFKLAGWAVVSNGSSYHKSHIHPAAWMSCVYYVVRPPASREPGTDRGFLSVGPPEWDDPLPMPGWGSRLVEPEPGTLVLMPAYFFHHTRPMGVEEERICVAIDVIPE